MAERYLDALDQQGVDREVDPLSYRSYSISIYLGFYFQVEFDHTPLELEGSVHHLDNGWPSAVSRTIFQVELHELQKVGLGQPLAFLVDIRSWFWPLSSGGPEVVNSDEFFVVFIPTPNRGKYRVRHQIGFKVFVKVFKEVPLDGRPKWTTMQLNFGRLVCVSATGLCIGSPASPAAC